MKFLSSAGAKSAAAAVRHPIEAGNWIALGDIGVLRARHAAAHPYRVTFALLALNAFLAALFVLAGEWLFSDPAEFFRELMPGTWLSFGELGFVAITAWAIHRALSGEARLRLDSFWSLSALVFAIFAIDEVTQLTIFLATALAAAGAVAPAGFIDLDSFLLVVLFLAAGAVLLRYARELLGYPAAVALLAVGVLLGGASQGLDSLLPATSAEFVAEESLKLAAEPFILGGYLVVLHRVLRREPAGRPGNARPA